MKLSIFASLILTAAAAPVLATPAGEPVTTEVRTDDLNLATREDRDRLDARVTRAARQLCAIQPRSLSAIDAEKRCVALALGHAAPQIELAIARSGKPVRLAAATRGGRG